AAPPARWRAASAGAGGEAACAWRTPSEGEPGAGEEARQPAGRVAVAEHALAGIGNARVGDALRGHLVEAVDVFRAHQAAEADVLVALVQAQALFTAHQQHAVGQHLVHGDRDGAGQAVLLRAARRAGEVALGLERAAKPIEAATEHVGHPDARRAVLAEAGAGALARLRLLVEHHGENVAHLKGALVVHQRAALAPVQTAGDRGRLLVFQLRRLIAAGVLGVLAQLLEAGATAAQQGEGERQGAYDKRAFQVGDILTV